MPPFRTQLAEALCLIALAAATQGAAGEKLFFNSDFELGAVGFSPDKYLRLDSNPELIYEGPATDDATAKSGHRSLKVPNRFAEQTEINFNEIQLKPNTEYCLSIAMKASEANCLAYLHFQSSWAWAPGCDNYGKDISVGKDWKTYEWKFKTTPSWRNEWHMLTISFGGEVDAKPCDLWLDSLQVVEGKNSDSSPMAGLEAIAQPATTCFIKNADGQFGQAELRVFNSSAEAVAAKLNVAAIEDSYGWKLFSKDFDVKLAPGESKWLPFEFPLDKFGAFRFETSLAGGYANSFATQAGRCVVVGEYEVKPLDPTKDFCVGLNAGIDYFTPDRWHLASKNGFRAEGRSPLERLRLLSSLGLRLARGWDSGRCPLRWQSVEPEEGKFDFSVVDKALPLFTKAGIEYMPVLGTFIAAKPGEPNPSGSGWPAWVLKKSKMTDKKMGGEAVYLPPMELWRRYVHEVAVHCKGRIHFYEFCNEPNLYLDVNVYVGYLKAAYEEIKAADPEAKVVGVCATGDMNGELSAFMESAMAAGALKYLDIVSFHPYNAPHLGSPTPADKQIQTLRAMIDRAGGKAIPLWNTEIYYLQGDKNSWIESEKHEPFNAACRILSDLGEGLGQSTSLNAEQVFENIPNKHSRAWCKDIPNGDLVAYSFFARTLQGAKPAGKVSWGYDTVCYVFERDGRPSAALWRYGKTEVKLNFTRERIDKLQLLDLYGNKLSWPSGTMSIAANPLYILPKDEEGMNSAAFIALLKSFSAEGLVPLEIKDARLCKGASGWTAIAALRNLSGKETAVGMLGIEGDGVVCMAKDLVAIPPGKTAVCDAMKLRLAGKPPREAVLLADINGRLWRMKTPLRQPVECIQAPLAAYGETAPIAVESKDKPSPHKANFKAKYDVTSLYLHVDVANVTPPAANAASEPFYWDQDCLELFFDLNPQSRVETEERRDVLRAFALPYAKEGGVFVIEDRSGKGALAKNGSRWSFTFTEGGYAFDLAIPLAALNLNAPLKGKRLGFDIAVDDASGKRRAQLFWSSGDAWKSRYGFGWITFK